MPAPSVLDLATSHEHLLALLILASPALAQLHIIDCPSSPRFLALAALLHVAAADKAAFPALCDLRISFARPSPAAIAKYAAVNASPAAALPLASAQRAAAIAAGVSGTGGSWFLRRFDEPEPLDTMMATLANTMISNVLYMRNLQHLDLSLYLTRKPEDSQRPHYSLILSVVRALRRPLKSLAIEMLSLPMPTVAALEGLLRGFSRIMDKHKLMQSFCLRFRKRSLDPLLTSWQRCFWVEFLDLVALKLPNLRSLELDMSAIDVPVNSETLACKPFLRTLRISAGQLTVSKLLASFGLLDPKSLAARPPPEPRSRNAPPVVYDPSSPLERLDLCVYKSALLSFPVPLFLLHADERFANVRHFTAALGSHSQLDLADPNWRRFLGRLDSLRVVADGMLPLGTNEWHCMTLFVSMATRASRLEWVRSRRVTPLQLDDWAPAAATDVAMFIDFIVRRTSMRQVLLDMIPVGAPAIELLLALLAQPNGLFAANHGPRPLRLMGPASVSPLSSAIPPAAPPPPPAAAPASSPSEPLLADMSTRRRQTHLQLTVRAPLVANQRAILAMLSKALHQQAIEPDWLHPAVSRLRALVLPRPHTFQVQTRDQLRHFLGLDFDAERARARHLREHDMLLLSIGDRLETSPLTPPRDMISLEPRIESASQ
ncbi:hypothetical protein HK105_204522 [Polyrhizophydium stewartii]|uniref:Uncharacterized protein n=1 Tax=Polyrhizophydium stewartii TaxID=2732419 RepID=A0ABR4N8F6_9FUNG